MRVSRLAALCALAFVSCKPTPPVIAPPPAPPAPDAELAPRDRLPPDTRPEAYQLTLEIDPDKPTYSGAVAIEVTLDRPRTSIWLHSRGPRVSKASVLRPGAEPLAAQLDAVGESGLVAVRLAQPVGPGKVTLVLPFEGDLGTHLTGLYRAAAGGVNYAFTQFEPISAREAFPCFDEPRFKAPFELKLRVRQEHVAIANTQVVADQPAERGLHELTFARTEKLPSYLIAFAVGPLDVVAAEPIAADTVRTSALPLRGVSVRGRGGDLGYALAETPALVRWLEGYFGVAYPWDKLDLIAVPDFGAGAMENAGAITFRDTLLLVRPDAPEQQKRSLGYVNAHELAHMWFGDLVTMPWWDDIWLNEAFATWLGTHAIAAVHPEYEAELGALSATHGAMEVDSRASARQIRQPIASDHDIENAFDAITYSKGGAVLSMFERYLGQDAFQAGLRTYMDKFRFGNATSRDLMQTLGQVSGQQALEGAFFSFLDQPGVPALEVALDCQAKTLSLTQSRYAPLGTSVPDARWQIPVCVRYGQPGAPAKETCQLLAEHTATVALEGACPTWVMPNAGAQGYYRWSLAAPELDALIARRNELATTEQMSLANNLAAALRAGTVDLPRALKAEKLLATSSKRHVLESALKTFWMLHELLADESLPAFRADMAKTLRPQLDRVGLLPRATKVSGEEKLSRVSVVRALYGLSEEPALSKELARLGKPLLAGAEANALPSELVELALTAAVREGGAAAYDAVQAQLFASEDGVRRGRLLSALANVRDPELSQRTLALTLDDKLRVNERLLPLLVQLGQRETRDAAFAWLRQQFDALLVKLGAHGGNDVIGATSSFCSAQAAQEVEQFFSPRVEKVPGGPRELALTLETIRACAAMQAHYAESLRAAYPPKK
jgi:alanyl aminopeptidase